MIELIFVIVVLGILAMIAIPKLAVTRDDALVAQARDTVAALRSAVATERQKRILRGDFTDINISTALNLLEYGLDNSRWQENNATNTLTYTGPGGQTCIFKLQNNRLTKQSCSVVGMDDL